MEITGFKFYKKGSLWHHTTFNNFEPQICPIFGGGNIVIFKLAGKVNPHPRIIPNFFILLPLFYLIYGLSSLTSKIYNTGGLK